MRSGLMFFGAMVLTGVLGAVPVQVAGQNTAPAEEEAMRKLIAGFAEAWNNHDAQGMAANWAEDGDYTGPEGQYVKGRAAIEAFLTDAHSYGNFATSKLAATTKDFRFIAPEVAVVNADIEITGQRDFFDKPVPAQKAVSTWVFLKKDGKWLTAVYRAFVPPPPPPPE